MKKIAIALTAMAGITFLSGCAYDRGPYYDRYSFNEYAYVSPYHHYYFRNGVRFDCVYSYDVAFCG
jgi:hypothetical protein